MPKQVASLEQLERDHPTRDLRVTVRPRVVLPHVAVAIRYPRRADRTRDDRRSLHRFSLSRRPAGFPLGGRPVGPTGPHATLDPIRGILDPLVLPDPLDPPPVPL